MVGDPLTTHEIGSLTKPPWRIKALRGQELLQEDLDQARRQGEQLGVAGHEALVELLKRPELGDGDREAIKAWSSRYALRMVERHLDVGWDGEQWRTEMYHYPVQRIDGFAFVGHVRSFDNKYYNAAAVVDEPSLAEPYHVDELTFLKQHAAKPVKIPMTGPYTLVDWSFDRFYDEGGYGKAGRANRREARREFLLDLATEVVRPVVKALVDAGAEWVQLDEPAVTTKPDEVDLWVEAFNAVTEGLDATVSVHICFSDYEALFPHVLELNDCAQLALEFANRDRPGVGVGDDKRPGYADLRVFEDHGLETDIGLGVVSIHDDEIEDPEVVRDRILHAADILGPERINPCPDCGLRTRTWEVADRKLRAVRLGTDQAREKLGLDVGEREDVMLLSEPEPAAADDEDGGLPMA